MEKTGKHKKRFGLVGKNISYSFSRGYFTEKFKDLDLDDHTYENFDLSDISEFEDLVQKNDLHGLNVTIPYKEQVIPYLDGLDETAGQIRAVNTIKVTSNGLFGFNTDAYGFQKSLQNILEPFHKNALILGTGGASKAIAFVFDEMDISFKFVSRKPREDQYSYDELDEAIISANQIIVNCTPLGTYPRIGDKPPIPYRFLSNNHLLFDLIYNPEKTAFLQSGEKLGCKIQNGLAMLEYQAEKAWEIWNS